MEEKVTLKNNKGFRLVANILGLERGMNKPVVIFAHGLRSSRDNPRNIYIAGRLVEKGFCAGDMRKW